MTTLLMGCGPSKPIFLPGDTHEFGPAFAHKTPTISHRFQVVNTTGKPVKIRSEAHSCGCLSSKLGKTELSPGEATELTMEVHVPPDYTNLGLETILATDHPDFPAWTYRLMVETFPPARVLPNRINLGTIDPNRSGTEIAVPAKLEVFGPASSPPPTITSGPPPRIDGIAVSTGEPSPAEAVAQGVNRVRFPIHFAWSPDRPLAAGPHSASITYALSDGTACSAQIDWTVSSPFEIEPKILHFGNVLSSDPLARAELRLASVDGAPFAVTKVEGMPPHLALVSPSAPPRSADPRQVVPFELRPEPNAFDRRSEFGELHVFTDRSETLPIVVPWSVFYSNAPGELALGPHSRSSREIAIVQWSSDPSFQHRERDVDEARSLPALSRPGVRRQWWRGLRGERSSR